MTNLVAHVPYPELVIPEYKHARFGRWSMGQTNGCMPGWYSPVAEPQSTWALRRREHGNDVVWMSCTPMERESHMAHVAAATGTVVVMGLGMGMYVRNVLAKRDVKQVIVIERDQQVIDILPRASDFDIWPGIEKLKIVRADARHWRTNIEVDYLYADFWKRMGDHRMAEYMRLIKGNVPNLKTVGYWTQEFDFADFARRKGVQPENVNASVYREWAESVDLPLLEQHSDVYALLSILAPMVQIMAKYVHDKDLLTARAVQLQVSKVINTLAHRQEYGHADLPS